ncbi:MAG: discoidin domain-containing protein, partial [Phycisphaerae bacterium]|nr:discoidin domain-containing protein [Phycisphaerae bacterium]
MKKVLFVGVVAFALSATAAASDIAFYVGAPNVDGWYSVAGVTQDVATIISKTGHLFRDVQTFGDSDFDAFGAWVDKNTDDGELDILWLNGCVPSVLYPFPNLQPDGSRIEKWLDGGNMVINVGDWFGYVSYEGGVRQAENGANGAANILDLSSGIIVSADNTTLTVTEDGRKYLPSLPATVITYRPVVPSAVVAPWEVAAVFAQNAAGTQADPIVIRNTVTNGYVAFINQSAGGGPPGWLPDRGLTCAEFIANWVAGVVGLGDPAQAANPVPDDGAVDVPRNVILLWKPGEFARTHDVYFGTVFEDVNTASRTDPKGVLVSQDQEDPVFDPQHPLAYGRTYYWRVDEVNAAPDNTIFKGLTWSFTVEPFSYPVTPIAATASSSGANMGPENTINGSGLNADDEHSTDATEMWTSANLKPHWIQYEFDQAYKFERLLVWNSNQVIEPFLGFGAKTVTIEYSVDGTNWTTLEGVPEFAQASGSADYKANTTVDLAGITARFVRLTITANWGGIAQQTGLSEVRFFYIPVRAFRPDPADGAADINIETALTWRPGREAASHEVRLGTGPDAMALAGTVDVPRFTPEPLALGTTYYWQVNEVTQAETVTTWAGNVWSFTTQAYRLVDDFEGYNNDIEAGGTIFQTWIDGYEVAANGATVGYMEAPFAETVVVRSGKQAMLLSYDNRTASYSEAKASVADLPIGLDWSIGSPETLVLWVCGDLANAATDQLYVKINNTKVTYPGSLSVPIWRQWNVDLAGIPIRNVSTLALGVDGKGAGRLYIDDIALYRQAPAIVGPGPGGDPSLVGHWKLDEAAGLIAADSSGYGNHGRLVGMAGNEWKAGTRGGALEFTGTGKYIDCGNDASLHLRGSVTISAWVKMSANNDGLYMGIGGKLKTDPYKGFSLVRHSSNVFRFWADNGAGVIAGYEADSDKPYTDTEWHHVVGVVDAGTSTLYVDRVKQAKQGTVSLTDSGEIAHIGRQYSGLDDRYWNGLID